MMMNGAATPYDNEYRQNGKILKANAPSATYSPKITSGLNYWRDSGNAPKHRLTSQVASVPVSASRAVLGV